MTSPDNDAPDLPVEVMNLEEARRVAAAAKALSDPVRVRIVRHLAASCCSTECACRLPELFGVSQPTMSHHLKKLLEAGLVDRHMRGRWAHYTLLPDGAAALRGFLQDVTGSDAGAPSYAPRAGSPAPPPADRTPAPPRRP